MSVLIVTMPGDVHAHAVCWAIERLGGTVRLLYPADLCDGAQWSFDPAEPRLSTAYRSIREHVEFGEHRAIWLRRPPAALPQEQMTDKVERAVAEDDFGTLARSMYLLLEQGRFAVNRIDHTRNAALKPFQFAVAKGVGLNVPRTLIGNSPEAILAFYDSCRGDVVFKPFKSPIWQTKQGPKMVPTTRLSRDMLRNCDLAAAPGIFQEHVAKCAEIRVTVMGRSVFAWEKRFVGRDDLDVDWRFMYRDAKHAPHRLQPNIEEACFVLLDRLGLVFGCFDFLLDDIGRYFFLEVNPQGQWLWGDLLDVGLNQLEAMAEFLLSSDPHFRHAGGNRLHLSEYSENTLAAVCKAEEEAHHGHLMTFKYHQASFRMESKIPG